MGRTCIKPGTRVRDPHDGRYGTTIGTPAPGEPRSVYVVFDGRRSPPAAARIGSEVRAAMTSFIRPVNESEASNMSEEQIEQAGGEALAREAGKRLAEKVNENLREGLRVFGQTDHAQVFALAFHENLTPTAKTRPPTPGGEEVD